MSFGDHVTPAGSIASAGWIGSSCDGEPWTVGSIVPNVYESVVHVEAPAEQHHWWDAYRQLFDVVGSVGARHTDTADRAWFAIWEGHGFDPVVPGIAPHERPDDLGPYEAGWARLPSSYRRRVAARRTPLAEIPRFELPNRSYYLVQGAVTAVNRLRNPGPNGEWRNPDLFWPDDRRWFVATDVDFWSLFVGGSQDSTTELAAAAPTRVEPVPRHQRLEPED